MMIETRLAPGYGARESGSPKLQSQKFILWVSFNLQLILTRWLALIAEGL
jgi:hypothetical protein